MSPRINGFSRRDFLRTTALAGAGLALPFALPADLRAALPSLLDKAPAKSAADFPILVIIELGGGNDGLNTVVPIGNDAYHRARPNLGLPRDRVIPLNDTIGLHQGLAGLKRLYDDGRVAIVNGAGYPNPDRSHFRSMEIWRTASDSNRYEKNGWLGRFLDSGGAAVEPLAGVAIGSELPQSFCGDRGVGVAFQDPRAFRWIAGPAGDNEEAFRRVNKVDGEEHASASTLGFMRDTTQRLALSSERVRKIASKPRTGGAYPQGRLARDLKTVADLILAGLPTRVYSVSYVGFDTHANQPTIHENLLRGFGEAVAAFHDDLRAARASERVIILCFSEFGRRVEENASRGTDHGTAGPMFLIGDSIQPGLHGRYPSLEDLNDGDLKYEVDFRSVYATVLGDWFHADSADVLHKSFPKIPLLKS